MPEPFKLVFLLVVVNGAPIMARRLLGERLSQPLDGGLRLTDGRRLFGDSKTWRGIVAGMLGGAIAAPLLGYPALTGIAFGLLAMLGDLASSFVKRRLGLAPSSQTLGLDQIPESALPLWFTRESTGLSSDQIWTIVALFILAELFISRVLFILGIRKRPY
ncbi:MAG TPA: CDP-archaeol synthase [Thiotrichales bacterium]|nr:CDP-archaeol synthase [Thiotrichales bacterium]